MVYSLLRLLGYYRLLNLLYLLLHLLHLLDLLLDLLPLILLDGNLLKRNGLKGIHCGLFLFDNSLGLLVGKLLLQHHLLVRQILQGVGIQLLILIDNLYLVPLGRRRARLEQGIRSYPHNLFGAPEWAFHHLGSLWCLKRWRLLAEPREVDLLLRL